MLRYPAAGGSTGLGSNHGSGGSSREARGGSDSSFPSSTSFGLPSSRRAGQLFPYKLKCDKEPLSSRFGPPDYYPPAANCPEEVLNRESCKEGYKEPIDGIDEISEVKLSLTSSTYNNTWSKPNVNRYKEAIRKRLRVLNNALIRKRKAGQVYGVALSGTLLAKPGAYPEVRSCGEDFRKKWIEDLSQRKRLRSLAEHVPHGYRRKALFEILIKHDVPLLRSTWFVKILYLNLVRPMSIGMSAGGPDKSQAKRVELWTKDVLDYAQSVLEEFCQAAGNASRSSSLLLGNQQQGGGAGGDAGGRGVVDVADVDLQAKWRYIVRLVQWHHSEGLIQRTQLVDWVLKQLQDKESREALELLLPIILKLTDEIALSQTHVRTFVDIALDWLRELCPAGALPHSPQTRKIAVSLTELLRYLLVMVPDTFVALDCFPLPSCVCPERPKETSLPLGASAGDEESGELRLAKRGPTDSGDDTRRTFKEEKPPSKVTDTRMSLSDRELIVEDTVERIQRRASSLAKAVNPGFLRNNEGKVVQGLDKALIGGDIQSACNCVFGEDFCSSDQLPDEWQADVVPGFGRTPSLLRSVNSSELFAIRFLCEWAVCEYRDSRGILTANDKKSTSVKDMSRVYMAVSVLRRKKEEMDETKQSANHADGPSFALKVDPRLSNGELNASSSKRVDQGRDASAANSSSKAQRNHASELMIARQSGPGFFASAGPLHDLIVAWLDQHELPKGESFERLQLLLCELVRVGLFWPDAYVRQLLCSGVLDRSKTAADITRAARHKLLLQHLPGPPQMDDCVDSSLLEAARLNRNERYLALHGYNTKKLKNADVRAGLPSAAGQQQQQQLDGVVSQADDCMSNGADRLGFGSLENRGIGAKKEKKLKMRFVEVKQAIASFLLLPDSCVGNSEVGAQGSRIRKGTKRRAASPAGWGNDRTEVTPGCEECSRSKRLKTGGEGKAWNAQALMPSLLDDEDTWWQKKGQKASDPVKVEQQQQQPPIRPSGKPSTRGRPKAVRKMQSLAQLQAARNESSQGASSSSHNTFDAKVVCPFHRSAPDGQSSSATNLRDRSKLRSSNSIRAIGHAIRGLRLNEKRSLSYWLDGVVRAQMGGGENANPSPGNSMGSGVLTGITSGTGDGGSGGARWRMTDDYLATIVYIMDMANDFHTLVHFLLWLLPMTPTPSSMVHSHNSRQLIAPAWNRENSVCEVGEAALLSYLRRYEGVLAAMDLLPQALRVGMQRAASMMAAVPTWRVGCAGLLFYVCDLLKKYGGLESVHTWEKNWKTSCDQRLSAELEALKAAESEGPYGMASMSSSGVGDDRDDPTPQRLTGRLARVGTNMKDIVQRHMNEAVTQIINREKDMAVSGQRDRVVDRFEEGHHTAQRVMEVIRQNGSGAPQGDSALVANAVSHIVNSVATAIANVFEPLSGSSHPSVSGASSPASLLICAKQVMQMHVLCLRLLKELLGDRHSRMLEVALATEANGFIIQAMQHPSGRVSRMPFRSSPEMSDNSGLSNEFGASLMGRPHISAAAAASFVALLAVQGITSLERMVTVLKLKENLETLQISKIGGGNPTGMSRSSLGTSNIKDHVVEAHVYWFRVLIGDCRMVGGNLVAELLGEANILGLARLQRLMPLMTVFSPGYALFAAALRRQPPSYLNSTAREDPVLQAAIQAVSDVVAHEPFRDVCLRDTHKLYLLLSSDSGESDYAAMLDMQGLPQKVVSMVPFRARLFLHSLLDRSLPSCMLQEEEMWSDGRVVDPKNRFTNEPRQIEQLVQVLDDLQPATFHWQWVELRLLLNEQVFIEKLEGQNMSVVEAVHAVTAGSDGRQLSECEKTFTDVVLTRLLVRPDAAALFSEAVHSLGNALEEYLILQVKWVLEGNDMLLGRKSLHQLLDNIANRQGFSVGTQRIKMWGGRPAKYGRDGRVLRGGAQERSKETASPEEGELAEGGGSAPGGKERRSGADDEALCNQQFATEKALADLVLPCLANSSNDTCSGFAFDLIKQMSNLEQQIAHLARSSAKSAPASSTGGESLGGKGAGIRRGARGGLEAGSPGMGRKPMAVAPDPSCLSAGALQTSMWLRLQFLLPLLPIIQMNKEQTARNMRQTLAPVLLRLLGTSVVQEAVESVTAKDLDRKAEASSVAATTAAGEGLFDRLLSVLHALLSSTWAVWLKPRPTKGPSKPLREVPPFDRETAERMQAELESMQLPRSVRTRLRAALPLLPPTSPLSISAGPPHVSPSAQALIQPSVPGSSSAQNSSSLGLPGISQKPLIPVETSFGKAKSNFLSDSEVELDPWLLLEDGVGSGSGGGSVGLVPGEVGNLKACSWLKGALRVRRTDLTYVGAVDEDS